MLSETSQTEPSPTVSVGSWRGGHKVPVTVSPSPPGGRRIGRNLFVLMVAIAVLVAVSFGAGSWYFAGQIEQGALAVDFTEPAYDIVVDSFADGWVTLHRTNGEVVDDPLRSSEVWG